MNNMVVRNINRADAESIRRLGEFGVATHPRGSGRTAFMRSTMRSIYDTARIGAFAVTVFCRPGNSTVIHAAIEVCKPGDPLEISCKANCIVGLVIDAGVREVADLAVMDFPVYSKAISAQRTVKEASDSVNIDVVCAGVLATSSRRTWPASSLRCGRTPRMRAACEKRVAKEATTRELYRAGKLGVELNGLPEKLKQLGVVHVDRANSGL